MTDLLHDVTVLDAVQTIAVIAGGFWTLVRWRDAVRQRAQEVRQREQELKWKRAKLAWDLTDQIHEAPDIAPALALLDHEADEIRLADTTYRVSDDDIAAALHFTSTGEFEDVTPKGRAIRASLDALLYALERLDHAIRLELISPTDVFAPTRYYAAIMARDRRYLDYAHRIGYTRAAQLVEALAGPSRSRSPVLARGGQSALSSRNRDTASAYISGPVVIPSCAWPGSRPMRTSGRTLARASVT